MNWFVVCIIMMFLCASGFEFIVLNNPNKGFFYLFSALINVNALFFK
jgi:hypothetical protein